ncbi:hypothetical protein F511_24403 [Dorcoceras hygrometricum]|uniref:Uncharacterized protein n=1 Tax=Dorcoceras hygrometricum TaxID=472368 RepID=A0A2Z7DIE6_9LAMI|nr:hypothetical protein F511_24403 [Dorcoceras hygrometricum]
MAAAAGRHQEKSRGGSRTTSCQARRTVACNDARPVARTMRNQCASSWQPAGHHVRNQRRPNVRPLRAATSEAVLRAAQHRATSAAVMRDHRASRARPAAHDQWRNIAQRFARNTAASAGHCASSVRPLADKRLITLLETRAWLRPVSRGNRHFTVGGGRLRQSGPRPEERLLRQPALEGLTRSARMDSPRQVGRNKFRRSKAATAVAAFERVEGAALLMLGRTPQNPLLMLNTLSSVSVRKSRIQYLCDPQWFRDIASRGPTTIVAPESQFRTCPSDHDSIGYPRMSASGESSTTMHRLLHASGSHPIMPPNDPNDQYNQDLGLIHSTNGNHMESPNEGSSIDHQVTIYLHAQNITMFPTNETWYFASQILVSSSGGLILILTAQSTRN